MSVRELLPEHLELFELEDDEPTDDRRATAAAARIAWRYGLDSHSLLLAGYRRRPYTHARAELYAYLHERGWSVRRIAAFVGRDRGTVLFGLRARAAGKYSVPIPLSPQRKKSSP